MPMRYRPGDVFLVPVTDEAVAVGHVVLKFSHGNILVAIYPELAETSKAVDLGRLATSRPVFLVQTMDFRIKDGTWKVLGSWTPPIEVSIPVYKTQLEFDGDFYEQTIDGSVGRRLTVDEAAQLRRPKSFSPAAVEAAIRAFEKMERWLPAFDEMRPSENA
jgi:hypothetical protein